MAALNARALIGRAVVSVADGEKVGAISDVRFDLAQRTVVGLLIGGTGGLFSHETPSFVPITHIHTFGRDAVTVNDKSAITVAGGAAHERIGTLNDIAKRVVTVGGEVIGDGDDVRFDEATGAITVLQLAPQGGFLGIGATVHVIPIGAVAKFGRDVITVTEDALTREEASE